MSSQRPNVSSRTSSAKSSTGSRARRVPAQTPRNPTKPQQGAPSKPSGPSALIASGKSEGEHLGVLSPAGITTRDTIVWSGGYIQDKRESLEWTTSGNADRTTSNRGTPGATSSGRRPTPVVVTQIPDHLRRSVLSNAIFLIDKPVDWTSTEVLRALKWALKIQHIGHSGSLDSTATGLVLVMTGHATKLTPALSDLDRDYSGVIRLGTATDTHDRAGKIMETMPWRYITDEMIQDAVGRLTGEIFQVPPFYSNAKYMGRPLYKYAERGQLIELPPRPAYVKAFSVERAEPGSSDLRFQLRVASGTYVRSIGHQLGKLLGSCSHIAEVRREAIGGFKVSDAWTLDSLIPLIRKYRPGFRDG